MAIKTPWRCAAAYKLFLPASRTSKATIGARFTSLHNRGTCPLSFWARLIGPDRENQYLIQSSLGSSATPISCVATPSTAVSTGALSREERRRRRRATAKYRTAHATRERVRVEAFNASFGKLRRLLPTLPPDKKLSKIEILRLAICYIAYLNHVLDV
ncbi:hypothetical protein J437_LFUL009687 [Ladona fulva]|uniref:BHLH domain-containing protein n=1 Tax=Ladona fulva TaxID=123851 RepID=A0A8K0P1B3_LADFU|nr:hypothetical protein J437_LFUL009687 [Ladona fulva]